MVMRTTSNTSVSTSGLYEEALLARQQTLELLRELEEAKHCRDSGGTGCRVDLYKQVTGASSLENALVAARRMLEAQERVLAGLGSSIGTSVCDGGYPTVRPLPQAWMPRVHATP
jgi:hypothetical protein